MFLEPTFHPQGASYSKMTAAAPASISTLQVARSWMGQWINDVLTSSPNQLMLRRFPRNPIQSTAILICKAGWEVCIFSWSLLPLVRQNFIMWKEERTEERQ